MIAAGLANAGPLDRDGRQSYEVSGFSRNLRKEISKSLRFFFYEYSAGKFHRYVPRQVRSDAPGTLHHDIGEEIKRVSPSFLLK
jgi:hypothetical protein